MIIFHSAADGLQSQRKKNWYFIFWGTVHIHLTASLHAVTLKRVKRTWIIPQEAELLTCDMVRFSPDDFLSHIYFSLLFILEANGVTDFSHQLLFPVTIC